jgi:hypothetical protein
MFAHPKCPCTPASLDELAVVVDQKTEHVAAYVVFIKPPGTPADWAQTRSRRQAEAIPSVRVSQDDGKLARHFGAKTSGHAAIYGPDGRLRYRGGLVGSRGQAGASPARRAAIAALFTSSPPERELPDFGCPLFDQDEVDDDAIGRSRS